VPGTPSHVVPSNVRVGDLLFCECRNSGLHSLDGWDHVAMYIGNSQFVEAVPDEGVWVANYNVYFTWATDITFGYVMGATQSDREDAVEFALGQVGKPYQPIPIPKNPSPDSLMWYCSELVWAAYLSVGFDLDSDGGLAVYPCDIAAGDGVQMYAGELPLAPRRPAGMQYCVRLETREYTTACSDPQCNDVYYEWDWDDGLRVEWWIGPCSSGSTHSRFHTWKTLGWHYVRVRCKDNNGPGPWSQPLPVWVDAVLGGIGWPPGEGDAPTLGSEAPEDDGGFMTPPTADPPSSAPEPQILP